MTCLTVRIGGHLPSRPNLRGHWRKTASLTKAQRRDAWLAFQAAHPGAHLNLRPPITITMCRVSARKLDDDNLAGAFKAVRDGVADWLGIDDGSPLLRWVCEQRRGAVGERAVTIEIVDRLGWQA